jgi:hypothetical protein
VLPSKTETQKHQDREMNKMQLLIWHSLAMIGVALSANSAVAQSPRWSAAEKYDQGDETSLAVHQSGLVVEVHQSHAFGAETLWYHLGTLNGTSVTWGRSQGLPWTGSWPNVAISKEGYVLFVFSIQTRKDYSHLYYAVGQIDPQGGIDQSITWLTSESRLFDSGYHSSIAMNDNGVILEVHESGSGGGGLYYRVGHLEHPTGGDPSIAWDSGGYGIKYDDGINPHIALNNHDEAVEVHQVTSEHYMHYRRGPVNGGRIHFGGSPRYDSNSSEASVALLDSGHVVEVHRQDDSVASARTGVLDPNDPERIEWSDSVEISDDDSDASRYPAVATNGTHAIGTWTSLSFDITGILFSSVALLAPQEENPFQWAFPIRVVPQRTNRKAKVRSPVPQKAVQPKSQSHGGASLGGSNEKAKQSRKGHAP